MRSVPFKELTKAVLYKSSPSIVDVLNNKNWQSLAFLQIFPIDLRDPGLESDRSEQAVRSVHHSLHLLHLMVIIGDKFLQGNMNALTEDFKVFTLFMRSS